MLEVIYLFARVWASIRESAVGSPAAPAGVVVSSYSSKTTPRRRASPTKDVVSLDHSSSPLDRVCGFGVSLPAAVSCAWRVRAPWSPSRTLPERSIRRRSPQRCASPSCRVPP